MFSAAAVGVPEDDQNWHRCVSPKVPSYWVYTKPIQKSQQDDREYRLIRLDNGLQAMLVHDAKADKAAASLDVAVGHLHDPVSNLLPLPPCLGNAHTWYFNRLTCRGLHISASIYYSWCSLLQSEPPCTHLTECSNRERNNFRRRMSTPRYAFALLSVPI
jgi:hypothetical protein